MYKTFIFLASFVVVLTLVGSVATGEIVFLDDFEDGSATDGDPVTWSPVPGLTGSFEVIDGDYVLTRPTDSEDMYCIVNQYTLADTSIRTQARLIGSGAWWFGIGARGNVGVGTYIALLKNNERLEIWRLGASAHVGSMLASADVGIDPRAQDVLLRFDVIGNELSAWAWREGDPMPAEPQVTAVHSELATGEVIVAADLGWQLSNNEAIFRYVEVYDVTPLVVDFNGDGIVDSADMCIMVDHWGEDYPLCDIGPMPQGDGIVDVQDLIVLSEHLFEEVDDPTLMVHWALDEVEGDIASDSANDNDGTVYGDPAWQPEGGMVVGALQLDGIDDYVSTPFVLNPADGKFSVLAWIKGGAPGQVVLSQESGAKWLCTDTLEGNLMTELKATGRGAAELLSQSVITDGNWHRIGLVWDGSHRTLYVDDVEVAKDTQDNLMGSDSGLYLGCGKAMEPGTYWSGLIDDVRIYNRAVIP